MRRIALALGRVLLGLLPRSLRREHGAEMEDTLGRRIRGGGGWRATRELGDLGATVGREWARELGSRLREWRGTGSRTMSGTLQDLRSGMRSLAARKGFTAVTLVTLAVGIGASTAIYTVVDTVLFRSLPFPEPDRLVFVWGGPLDPGQRSTRWWTSYPDYVDYVDGVEAFEELAAFRAPSLVVSGGGRAPVSRTAARVTSNFFRTVGIEPVVGRVFSPSEDRVGADPVVVLSHGLARDWFGADVDPLGHSLMVNGRDHTVVGVMPPGFDFPQEARLWLPAAPDVGEDSRGSHRLILVGRLAEGVDVGSAGEQVYDVAEQLARTYPDSNAGQGAWAEPLLEAYVGDVRMTLLVLLGATVVVLLVACANVAHLFLVRTAARRGEIAVRTALGASRVRVVRSLLAEALLVAVGGGVAGVGLAWLGVRSLIRIAPPGVLPRADEISVDGGVLAVAAAATLGTVMLFGLLPALGAARRGLGDRLRESAGRRQGRMARGRLRGLLVVAETALAMALVVSGGLLVRSFRAVNEVDAGFEPQGLVVVPVSLPTGRYPIEDWPPIARFFERLVSDAARIPGVESAAVAYAHPLDPAWTTSFWFPDRPEPEPGRRPEASYRPVSPGYFRTAGIPVVRGREFLRSDDAGSPGVVVVNRSFAREFFPGENPVGRRLRNGTWWEGTPDGDWEVVGVVEDVKFDGLENPTPWAVYYAHAQRPMSEMFLVVRVAVDAAPVVPLLRETLWSLDPELPAENIRTMEEILDASVAPRRFVMTLLAAFGFIAALLAAVGLYGVVAYSVSRRSHELGVRRSLGATGMDVVRIVVGRGLRLTVVGVVLGLGLALASGRLVEPLLFGVRRDDPATVGSVAAGLLAVALVASALPAWRATRLDPARTLRTD